ncbi:Carboxypeptidase Taq [Gluconacetobacter diazotrophicus PA1 5]|uniref:Metal-dependent carboxypeptidase n=1 Tax=Gluconacetobacter diazotrophicus (strain ATCC 49037 / DSM 5601 / CCUG 37298 / CIP 103539 / LMG 7603 / PAl5) TaxID=272568 RepID=A9HKD9_GLUDA|nr:carboxypeptidase M32 [Gluconacetobacter diazotrophicus]ACI50102.1 Carboxypeptidase Taq [Gluconacetobacter diazotrophicus PA1 5]TWB07818.1 carboxypeptidase Taq [Gluconacetobacter diazotrophicus]CAP56028.1 Thermostable carboxypeptidase 1 [Gluconacetobacter diazotrophicus PA1 5]
MPQHAYTDLTTHFARIGRIRNALGILGWDKDVMMPAGAAESRADSIATLDVLCHEILTAPVIAELLDRAEAPAGSWQAANLQEMRRAYLHAASVPADLVDAMSRAASRCEMAWRAARREGDFAALLPTLSEVLDRTRDLAVVKGAALGLSPYDALLDQYDPGTRRADIDPVFAELRRDLPALIADAQAHQAATPAPVLPTGPFPVPLQEQMGRRMMMALGFDMERGRLDVSAHPFCGGAEDDVRITTRYEDDDFLAALMGVIHETGHALYEQGLPHDWRTQPVGQARGMSLHESQSLLMEMQVARSRPFMDWAAPLLRAAFGGAEADPAWSADSLYRAVTRVRPGFIRVDADEVTYPAHVLVRYEMETALVDGTLALRDLPEAFNAGIHGLLGLTVPNDRLGCLQDIHWPSGAWGYFPTYTMGAILAAQLRQAAFRADPAIPSGIAQGDFAPLLGWLRTHVHSQASRLSTPDIIRAATGAAPSTDAYRAHLRERYCGAE